MKYYKNENNRIWSYEDHVPEFEQGNKGQITVKEGLIAITEDEAKIILAETNKPTKDQVIASNESAIKSLIDQATLKIDILNDAINFGKAKGGDEEKLIAWRKYRVDLSKVDTNLEEMDLPEKPKA